MTGIIVGVDGSAGGGKALRWAVQEGAARGWPVTALLAWGWLDEPHDEEGGPLPFYDEDKARLALDAAISRALPGGADVERVVVLGLAARELVDRSADASLLVVGARGLGTFKRLLLGSVSEHCLHHALCPVAVIRSGAGSASEFAARVVVGVDGSEGSRAALAWAVDEAAARGVELEAVHAWQYPPADERVLAELDSRVFEQAAATSLERDLASVPQDRLAQPVIRSTVCDGAGHALVAASEGAGVAVVGSRGHGGFTGLLLGSVSQQLAHHAHCPVVIVPHNDEAAARLRER